MTVAFEQEEQQRHDSEATLLSFLGGLTGLFDLRVTRRQRDPDAERLTAVASYDDRSDAERDVEVLASKGILGTLEVGYGDHSSLSGGASSPIIELKVTAQDAVRAGSILNEVAQLPSQKERPQSSDQEISFECEECGKMLRFAGNRRGGVETCPHCFEYVDVPD